jgi:hypothetical protein
MNALSFLLRPWQRIDHIKSHTYRGKHKQRKEVTQTHGTVRIETQFLGDLKQSVLTKYGLRLTLITVYSCSLRAQIEFSTQL